MAKILVHLYYILYHLEEHSDYKSMIILYLMDLYSFKPFYV
ncbi:MAG: hypothetical protein BAJALOKI2v1_170057, partial [Promethearchaeota archaeon]